MKRILIIGGTRNLGHQLAMTLLERGDEVTILNRGQTPDSLPPQIERLRGDRSVPAQLDAALGGRDFDAVVDTALYTESEAKGILPVLRGRTGHYIFLSTGQVYLVREDVSRPFSEEMYTGRIMPEPKRESFAYPEWLYGVDKRAAEDVLEWAGQTEQFPYTSLRIPMVNSERDHFFRLYNYIIRMQDGGPLLVPENPDHGLRHIYGGDVVTAILRLVDTGLGKGQAYNISQDETTTLDEFLAIVGAHLGVQPRLRRFPRPELERQGFLPGCSPFSERWMSELTNERSKRELGIQYTPLADYLGRIVRHYQANPPPEPLSYLRRRDEIAFADEN